MLYEPLVALIEKHKLEIARMTAEAILALKVPGYAGFTVEPLTERVMPTVEMVARYAHSGDPSEYRDYIVKLAETRLPQGFTAEDLIAAGRNMFDSIIKIIEREYPGPENEKTRLKFQRRLEGVHGLGQSVVVATRVKRGTTNIKGQV